jgi:hypothetical protein
VIKAAGQRNRPAAIQYFITYYNKTMLSQPMKFPGGPNEAGGQTMGQDGGRCQSCGMPLGAAGFYGTNADGSEQKEYCKFCFQNGAFVQPELTVEGMIESSTKFMSQNMGMPEDQARTISERFIPTLKRWQK